MYTLHQHPLSTFARRIRIMFLEKGITARFVDVDMAHRQHQGPEYRRLNPYGRVPALVEDDGFVLVETTAILEYLEARHPEPALIPSSSRDRAQMAMHLKLCDLEFTRFTRELFFPRRFFPREKWNLDEMNAARSVVQRHFDILETQLQGREFLAGGRYTLAELCYTPFVDFLPLLEITTGPNVAGWIERLQSRPSAQQTRLPR